jgi:hypothetical protein
MDGINMIKGTIGNTTVLYPNNGGYLTNGETFSETVYLGKDADESVWRDATAEEYEEWQRQQEEPEPTEEEALTRYANELTGENDPDLVSATESLITKFTEE